MVIVNKLQLNINKIRQLQHLVKVGERLVTVKKSDQLDWLTQTSVRCATQPSATTVKGTLLPSLTQKESWHINCVQYERHSW